MAGGRIVTTLDVGSWKVCALIGEIGEDGRVTVLGTGQRASRGVRRGAIYDRDAAESAVRETLEQAESIAGFNVEAAWIGFAAASLKTDLIRVEADQGGHQIEDEDVESLLREARSAIDPDGRTVLHAQPALYTLDDVGGVKHPRGLHADRLSVDVHIVAANGAPIRNLDYVVRSAQLRVSGIVASPLASGLACLTEEERELGVALIEVGAAVTSVTLFTGGMPVGLSIIEQGGADITDDIASAFGTTRTHAERIKCVHGSAASAPRDNSEQIDMAPVDEEQLEEVSKITRAQLVAVIQQRLATLAGLVDAELKRQGFAGAAARHVVLTGGTAELKGMADYLASALGRTVRIGRPRRLHALPDAHSGPGFSAMAGLALYASSNPLDVRTLGPAAVRGSGKPWDWRRWTRAMRSNL